MKRCKHLTCVGLPVLLQDLCRLESSKVSLLTQADALEEDSLDLILDALDLMSCLHAVAEEGGAEWDMDVSPEEFVSQKLNQKLLQQIQVRLG